MGLISWWNSFEVVKTKDLQERIANAVHTKLEEERAYDLIAEGDALIPQSGWDGGTSLFESSEVVTEKELSKKIKYKGSEELIESREWLNVGLNIGTNPENDQNIGKLRLSQDSSMYQWINFPIARSIIENVKRYVIGRGVKFDIPVPEIFDYISLFWRRNNMERRNKQSYRDYLLQGEVFWLFMKNKSFENSNSDETTPIIMRRLHPSLVEVIEVDPDDYETNLSYTVSHVTEDSNANLYYLDHSHPPVSGETSDEEAGIPKTMNGAISVYVDDSTEKVEEERVMMFKAGTSFDIRGRVFMESVLRWNRLYMDFVYDRGRLNHLRTKIYLIETRTSAGARTLGNSFERMPKGGVKLIETNERTFRFEHPQTGASDAKIDGNIIGYLIGSGTTLPLHILLQNAENNNYASIREAGNPFAQMVNDLQDDWRDNLIDLLRYVIEVGVKEGVLDSEYTIEYFPGDVIGEAILFVEKRLEEGVPASEAIKEVEAAFDKTTKVVKTVDVPIHIIFPDVVQADPKAQAETLQLWTELGYISRYFGQVKIGADPEVEKVRMAREFEEDIQKAISRQKEFDTGTFFPKDEDEDEDDNEDDNEDENKTEDND